jgi:LSD1 subclass zinc finger protein
MGRDIVATSSDIDSSNLETAESMDDRDTAPESAAASPSASPRPARSRNTASSNARKMIVVVWEKRYKRLYVSPMIARVPATLEERKRCRTCLQFPSGNHPAVECRVCHAIFHPDCEEPPFQWAYEASHIVCSQECCEKLRSRVQWLQEPNYLLASGHLRNISLCVPDHKLPTPSRRGIRPIMETAMPQAPPMVVVGDCVMLHVDGRNAPAIVRAMFFDTMAEVWFFYSILEPKGSGDFPWLVPSLDQVDMHPPNPVSVSCITSMLGACFPLAPGLSRLHLSCRPTPYDPSLELPEFPCAPLSTVFN